MSRECFFSYNEELDTLLGDVLDTALHESEMIGYIISNLPGNAKVFAPEINFYCKNSRASLSEQADTILRMYRARLDLFDFSKETFARKRIGNTILVISGSNESLLQEQLERFDFQVQQLKKTRLVKLTGEIGSFQVAAKDNCIGPHQLFDQIIWDDMPEKFQKISGIHNLKERKPDEIIQTIVATPGEVTIPRKIHYQKAACLQYFKGKSICSGCLAVCQSGAVEYSEDGGSLQFNHSACTGCGSCVSQCPVGALDSTSIPRETFAELCSHYVEKNVVIIPETIDLENLEIDLPAGVIPLPVKNALMFDENYLLTLVGTSCRDVVIYCDANHRLLAAIDFVNQVYHRKFGRNSIFHCSTKEELELALVHLNTNDYITRYFTSRRSFVSKRAETSFWLENLVANDNLGVIETNGTPPLGSLAINTENCTLCLACAGACPMKALTVHPEDNSLRFTASLCIQCGHCSLLCPEENCLSLVPNHFLLEAASFSPQIVARDELFSCLECGREFAPRKAVQKIIDTMSQHFSDDSVKLKTLSCCPDCKAKLMIEQQIFNQQGIGV